VPLDILVVDDDQATRLSLAYALTDAGHKVTEACDGEEAIALVAERIFDVAMLDVRLPKVDGLTIFRRLRQRSPSTSVILMTAFATVRDAVGSLRDGAYDYVTKPFDPEEFTLRVIGHIAEHRALRQELEEARTMVASRDAGAPIIGYTPGMQQLIERIHTVAQSDAPVLIRGESGTGKALIAHTLHARSPRKNAPFVAVNCAAFPEALIESELFGHESGAFTGAVRKREGRFEAADGGTLLLDEVAELPLPVQAKLLRVLEDGVIERLGTSTQVPVDVRIVSATHRDLKELIAQGKFREELYLRINVLDLDIPPLRERRADMPLLVAHFLRRFYPGRVPPGIAPRAWDSLMEYAFPGNVRELAHAIERAVVLSHGSEIDLEHLPSDIVGSSVLPSPSDATFRPLGVAMKEFEKQYLQRALRLATGGKGHAAELLGISRKNLRERLNAQGIPAEEEAESGQPSSGR
jgi:DNA-binding NtrC family response regulator